MGRIMIEDLPEDHKISKDEMRKVMGGTLGDDSQLALVDLQNWTQKTQQTMTMMSQISRILHDTSMAVVRKMG